MYDEVTRLLVMTAATPTAAVEFSRATSLEGFNTVQIEVWIISVSGSTTLVARFEGSNDLCNWTENLASLSLTAAPDHQLSSMVGPLPWKWGRIRYEATGSGTFIAIRGAIRGLNAE